mgnify:FL=1
MCPHYEHLKYQVNMSNADAATWAGLNESLPILMVEMAQASTLVEHAISGTKEIEDYVREFCGCYRRLITTLERNGMTRGMTLREIVKSSLRAAKAYARSSTDCDSQIDNIHKRMAKPTWELLGKRLQECLQTIVAQSEGWTNDTARDFTSTEWTTLESVGTTSFTGAQVSLAEDLESADQMLSARARLEECASDTADHVGLLIQWKEQLGNHKAEKEQWMAQHGQKEWFKMSEYRGLAWSDDNRNDRWPDYEYHEYQTICSAISAEEGSIIWEMNEVNRLVPQFWAYAQVLSKAWFEFTDGLHECEDEWNQKVGKQIQDVCQMISTADLLPVDYIEWVNFMKGWIDNFKITRTRLLTTRAASAAGYIPAAATEQSEVVG